MPVETFTKKQFENTLPENFTHIGLEKGEETYTVEAGQFCIVKIRSSIKSNGISALTGKDSIRMWLTVKRGNSYIPLGKRPALTQRIEGWEGRMETKLSDLIAKGKSITSGISNCPECNQPLFAGLSKSEKNKDRPYAKCFTHFKQSFTWLDVPIDSSEPKVEPKQDISPTQEQKINTLAMLKMAKEAPKEIAEPQQASKIKLNPQQKQAVGMPVNSNYRVLAPPGSGKTTGVMVPRYKFLADNGIKSESIVAVAFNVKMADELRNKILTTLPNLSKQAQNQICTIHAFCYRQLLEYWRNNDRKVLVIYNWKEHKSKTKPEYLLKNIIDDLWPSYEDKPGWKEVKFWIDNAKFRGLTFSQSKEFFQSHLGEYGRYVQNIRIEYDTQMKAQGILEFPDMLYLFERLLIENSGLRRSLQARFTHVMVDEAQDVSEQALRILTTVSQKVGWNKIYEGMI
jgi:hypothetical protein